MFLKYTTNVVWIIKWSHDRRCPIVSYFLNKIKVQEFFGAAFRVFCESWFCNGIVQGVK